MLERRFVNVDKCVSIDTSQAADYAETGSFSRTAYGGESSRSRQQLEDFADLSSGYFFELDRNLQYQYLSDRFSEITGIPRRMILGLSDADIDWLDDVPESGIEYLAALRRRDSFIDKRIAFLHPNGCVVRLSVNAKVIRDAAGEFSGIRGVAIETNPDAVISDVEEGAQAAYKLAGRIANVGFWEWDEIADNCTFCSEELARLYGVSVQEFLYRSTTDVKNRLSIHADDKQRYEQAVKEYKQHRQGFEIEYRLMPENAESVHVLEVVVPIVDENNELVRSFGFVKDISGQKEIAAALEQTRDDLDTRVKQRTAELERINKELSHSKSLLREATRVAKLGYFRWSAVENRCIYRDGELSKMLGAGATDYENETTSDFLARVHPEDLSRVSAAYTNSGEKAVSLNIEYRIVQPSGEVRYVNECSTPETNADGNVIETFGTMQDITERMLIAEELARVEERLSELGENAREVLYVLSADWREVIYVSKAFEDIWGRSCESLIADPRIWYKGLHPDDRDTIYAEIERKMSGDDPTPDFSDARIIGPKGDVRWLAARVYPIRNENGTTIRFAGVAEDITERKTATDALHHAQKLEAVGQLTGGVAHDFNNLLAVILGNTELVLEQCAAKDAALLEDVLTAGRHGAELTKRLLAFSRLQPLRPIRTDLNDLINGMGELLRRTLGTLFTVQLQLRQENVHVYVDPGLLQNAILNLALNSRDAMAGGGRLQIVVDRADRVAAGSKAVIAVIDNGMGMSTSDLSRALEPFFTTKNLGEGTGLGLPMVYGFVKQSNGDMTIDSKLGEGTTVTIQLPSDRD